MRVSKWGNSLAVRLPVAVVEALGLKDGDEVELRPLSGHAVGIGRRMEREAAIARLREFRGLLPADFKFDRDEANER